MTFDWNKDGNEAKLLQYEEQGIPRREIAKLFGISPDAVKTKISRLKHGIVAKPPARHKKKQKYKYHSAWLPQPVPIIDRNASVPLHNHASKSPSVANKPDAELIAEAIASGKVRRFETSATGDFMHLQNWLLRVHKIEVKKFTQGTTKRPFAIGKKRLDHNDFYGLVNKLRAKDGKEPLVRV